MVVLVVALLGCIIGVIWGFIDGVKGEDIVLGGGLGAVIGVLIGILVWLIGCAAIMPTEPVVTDTIPIYAMSDTMGVEGSFCLGSGYVDSELKYVYAAETEKGIAIKTVDADNAYIKYIKDGEAPYVEKIEYHHKSKFVDRWFSPYMHRYETYIYVPEGTVKTVYNIDLE